MRVALKSFLLPASLATPSALKKWSLELPLMPTHATDWKKLGGSHIKLAAIIRGDVVA